MDLTGIEEAVSLAEQRWPGVTFRIKGDEAHGPCPICGQADEDGFIIFDDGGFYCRPGDHAGWLDDDNPRQLTLAEQNAIEIRRMKRRERERDRRLSALERMHHCTDHLTYHKLMDAEDRKYWHSQGIYDDAIDRYLLGTCYACPTDLLRRPSYTIPVINGGQLVNIRHRLIGADNGDKYRPHMAGLGNTLFDADHLYNGQPEVTIVEGEKKSIVVGQYGFNTVGIMGKGAFPPAWATRFQPFQRVNVCLDPDAEDRAVAIARLFGERGYLVRLPDKIDDYFLNGGTPELLKECIRLAWRVD